MRLLNTETFEVRFFGSERAPDYVILSHRWLDDQDQEVTFEDIIDPSDYWHQKQGCAKIQGVCRQAKSDGYQWVWIDSCCIDRASSAELQETINSMWDYYKNANICYVYLYDIAPTDNWTQHVSQSSWWTRGWTLQELLAPDAVEFYANDWSFIGTKFESYAEIARLTGINPDALTLRVALERFSVAEKLSWAAHRQVTRPEDEAYSLLGLFQVNLSLLYGEGRIKAFFRLQQAVFAATGDSSIFLFRYSSFPDQQPLLADSPTKFCSRTRCDSCAGQTVCFPITISYAWLRPGRGWLTRAFDTILPSVRQDYQVFTTTLHLLEYSRLPWDVTRHFPADGRDDDITHIAALNFTTAADKERSIFCLPLCKRLGLDSFERTRHVPFLVPREVVDGCVSHRVIICPRLKNPDQDEDVMVKFVVSAGMTGAIERWEHPYSSTRFELGSQSSCTLWTKRFEPRNSPELTAIFTLAGTQRCSLKISLRPYDYTWSIVRVLEFFGTTLYETNFFSNRCRVQTSTGVSLLISLRRLPAVYRQDNGTSARTLCFQLGINTF